MKPLLPLLLFLPLATACTAGVDPVTVLNRFDPDITTAPMEAARVSALRSRERVTVTPGQYCFGFEEARKDGAINGRLELTLRADSTYAYADRYVYRGFVRARNEVGAYRVTGHSLTLVSGTGVERTLPLTSATPMELRLWGASPLSTAACTASALTGDPLKQTFDAALAEQARPVPWPGR